MGTQKMSGILWLFSHQSVKSCFENPKHLNKTFLLSTCNIYFLMVKDTISIYYITSNEIQENIYLTVEDITFSHQYNWIASTLSVNFPELS